MLSARSLWPALLAFICAASLLGFLWWQLQRTHALLANTSPPTVSEDAGNHPLLPESPLKDADASLLHLRRGDVFALQGSWEQAVGEYEKAVENGGGTPALRKLIHAQLQKRDIPAAQATLAALKRSGLRSEDILLLESIVAMRTGEIVQAQSMLESAPDSPQKHYASALLAITQGRHEDARGHLDLVIAGWEPVLRLSARTLKEAYDEYALFPESPDTHLMTLLSRALAQVQECEIALPLLSQVVQKVQDYRDAWMVQGYCELMTGRSPESLASFERAYALDPQKPEIQYFLARAYIVNGDDQSARTFLQYALLNGFSPASETHRLLAEVGERMGDGALALEHKEALTKEDNASIDAYAEFVETASRFGQPESAYLKAVDATKRWPDDSRSFLLLGYTALHQEKKEEAKAAFEKALALDPDAREAKEELEKMQ